MSEFFKTSSKLLRIILKTIGPRIDPWGTSEIKTFEKLKMSSILTLCSLRFKYEQKNVAAPSLKP